jgi:hypothetical protein
MSIATEIPTARTPGNAKMRLVGGDAECDLCGRPVRREIAFERIHRGGDDVEIVAVCPECEIGTD